MRVENIWEICKKVMVEYVGGKEKRYMKVKIRKEVIRYEMVKSKGDDHMHSNNWIITHNINQLVIW